MKEKRELLLKVARQLKALSEFIEKVENSVSIQVETKALEPQLRTCLESISSVFDALSGIHEEALQSKNAELEEKTTLTTEVQQLREKIQQLSSLNEELQNPPKRKRKTK